MNNLSRHPLLARFPNLANVQVIVDFTRAYLINHLSGRGLPARLEESFLYIGTRQPRPDDEGVLL